MTSPTGVPAKIARLVTEAQGAILKITEAIQAMHERKPIEGRYVKDELETVWDRIAAALNEASGYGVVLNLSVRKDCGPTQLQTISDELRVRIDIPAKIFQHEEVYGTQKILTKRLNPTGVSK